MPNTYTREIRAGKWIKRTTSNIKPKGGQTIEWIWEESTDGTEQYRTNEYMVCSTGEIKTKNEEREKRTDNIRQLRIACERFKWRVRANAERAKLFITLTYSENMTDTKQLYEDFRRFWQKMRRKCGASDYLVAFEPQERGAWHCHVITLDGADYIPNATIAELWGLGFCKTKRCSRVADLGNYLTAYLTKFDGKKGSRLSLYPARFRFLRWSKGVIEPETLEYEGEKPEPNPEEYKKIYDKSIEKVFGDGIIKMKMRIREYVEMKTYSRYLNERKKKKKKFSKKILTESVTGFKLTGERASLPNGTYRA